MGRQAILIPGVYKKDDIVVQGLDDASLNAAAPDRNTGDTEFTITYPTTNKTQTIKWLTMAQEGLKVVIPYAMPIYTEFSSSGSVDYGTYKCQVQIYKQRLVPSEISRGLVYASTLGDNPSWAESYTTTTNYAYDYDVKPGETWDYICKYTIYDDKGDITISVENTTSISIAPVVSEFITLKNAGGNPLYIKFNEKLGSFKYNYADTITATLGSPYPFVRRNGYQKYRTFTLEGLISFEANKDFATLDPNLWKSYNAYDAASIQEKLYRDKVIEFLHDGAIKLYSSFQEGNMLIRLSNVSLTPNDQLSRHIWSFSATATEIAAATPDNIAKYGFN